MCTYTRLSATILGVACFFSSVHAQESSPPSVLTLQSAIQRTLRESPRLKSARESIKASDAGFFQAGIGRNPELDIYVENVVGNGPHSGLDRAELTLGLSQVLEMGDKRSGRLAVAEQIRVLTRFGYLEERLALVQEVSSAYFNAVAAQEMIKLTEKQRDVAQVVVAEVGKRVDAARESPLQKYKADMTLSMAIFSHDRARRDSDHARQVLLNLWNTHEKTDELEDKTFFSMPPPITKSDAEALLEKNPSLQKVQAELVYMQAKYHLEKAHENGEFRLSGGIRNLSETGHQAFLAGISIPLPLVSPNQGNIEKAKHEAAKAEHAIQTVKWASIAALREALERMTNAYYNAKILQTTLLPAAEKAFTLSREGYRAGRFSYLDVLDSSRTFFDAKAQYITALKDYHSAKSEIDRLTARYTNLIKTKEELYEN